MLFGFVAFLVITRMHYQFRFRNKKDHLADFFWHLFLKFFMLGYIQGLMQQLPLFDQKANTSSDESSVKKPIYNHLGDGHAPIWTYHVVDKLCLLQPHNSFHHTDNGAL